MIKDFILAQEELHTLSLFLDSFNQEHSIFLLQGDLASGKTTLIKHYISHHNSSINVTSPTFNFMQEYEYFYHYDLYHHGLHKALQLGLLEKLDQKGIHFIEWGDEKLESILTNSGYNYSVIKIIKLQNKRLYRIIYGQTPNKKS